MLPITAKALLHLGLKLIAVAWHNGHIFFLADPYGHHSRSRVSSDSNPSTAL
jgi:hypothetical protein